MDGIYLDNNATTPVLPEVVAAMAPLWGEAFGNPASAHAAGRSARRALEDARERVAACLDAAANEVVFTSGATESNNLALFGLQPTPPDAVLASPIEHPSVVEPLRRLAETDCRVEFLPVDGAGHVSADTVAERLGPDTRLLTVMLANHEMGAVQPVAEMVRALPSEVPCHCDAVQAVGRMPVSFHRLGVATLSASGHKFHGPKGVGLLLVRRGVRLRPLHHGGHQQGGLRPGTEPVALAVGLATALELACRDLERRRETVSRLRRRFLDGVRNAAAPVVLNGPVEDGMPHTLNLSFPGLRADVLLMGLDLAGVACSAGSACSSGSLLPSPVLRAMNVPDDVLTSAVRFSFSHLLTDEAIDEAVRRVADVVRRQRSS
jgi:cysteine desulfurase